MMLFHRPSKHGLINEDHVRSSLNRNTASMIQNEFNIVRKLENQHANSPHFTFPGVLNPPITQCLLLSSIVWTVFSLIHIKEH